MPRHAAVCGGGGCPSRPSPLWDNRRVLSEGEINDGGRTEVILTTSKIEDFDRFWRTFSTKGAEKRKQHGSKGASVFRDPNDDRRVWVLFDWDEEGFRNFLSDPDVPAIFKEGGLKGRPQPAELAREHDV
jgi:hypothetical protein